LALLGLSVWFIFSGIIGLDGDWFSFGPMNESVMYSVSANDIDNLTISWTTGAVSVDIHDSNYIRITEFSRRALREGQQLDYRVDNNILNINFRADGARRRHMPAKRLEILIPRALSQGLNQLNITTTTGRITIDNIHASELSARTTTGRVELNAVYADIINLRTTTGRVEAFNTEVQAIQTHTTTGRHEISGTFGAIDARSTTGRIELTSTTVPNSIVARATTGRISVVVPNGGEPVTVQQSTTTGRFSSDIPIVTHSSADAQFRLTTTTGRISIYELRR